MPVENLGRNGPLPPLALVHTHGRMPAKKKIPASDVAVGNRTLDAVLLDFAEQIKENNIAIRASQARIDLAFQEIQVLREDTKALREDMKEQNERFHSEMLTIHSEMRTIHNEIRMLGAGMMAFATRTDERLRKLEDKAA